MGYFVDVIVVLGEYENKGCKELIVDYDDKIDVVFVC